jgi:hypothetical protein
MSLRLKYFDRNQTDELSDFIEKHPPRGKNGMSIPPDGQGVFIFYETGDSTSKTEVLVRLREQLREETDKLIIALPDSKVHELNHNEMQRFLSDMEGKISEHRKKEPEHLKGPEGKRSYDQWKAWKVELETLEDAVKEIEKNDQSGMNLLLMNDNTVKTSRGKIRALKILIREIEEDKLDIFEAQKMREIAKE